MATPAEVERLLTALGLPLSRQYVDWGVLEASLGAGVRLPTDFKEFIEQVPIGRFGIALTPLYPGLLGGAKDDFLSPVIHITETFRDWRKYDQEGFPYPLFPEAGGLLVWAFSPHWAYYWLTTSADPDQWTVVRSDQQFTEWSTFDGGMAEYLLAEHTAGRLPAYQPFAATPPATRQFPKDNETPRWPSVRIPIDQSSELITAVSPPANLRRDYEWAALEQRMGRRLPADYKAFLDACGPGQLCDIEIYDPHGCRCTNMIMLQEQQLNWMRQTPLIDHLSFYPAQKGLLCWGTTTGGSYFNWKSVSEDPDEWSIATITSLGPQFYDDLSLSSFLLRYSGATQPALSLLGGPVWSNGLEFTPHRCSS